MNVEEAYTAYVMATGVSPSADPAKPRTNELDILLALGRAQEPPCAPTEMLRQLIIYEEHHGHT